MDSLFFIILASVFGIAGIGLLIYGIATGSDRWAWITGGIAALVLGALTFFLRPQKDSERKRGDVPSPDEKTDVDRRASELESQIRNHQQQMEHLQDEYEKTDQEIEAALETAGIPDRAIVDPDVPDPYVNERLRTRLRDGS